MSATRPAVTGAGVLTPIGSGLEAFWQSLLNGVSGSSPVRSFDTSNLPHQRGCEVDVGTVPDEIAGPRESGRCTELALAAVRQALSEAGLEDELRGRRDVALVVGTTMGEVTRFEQDRARHPDSEPGPDDVRSLVERPLDVMARRIAGAFDLAGPVQTTPAACAAGSYAVGLAASLVHRGAARAAIAVGCEAFSRLAFVGFSRMRAMSPDVCRPFSLGRPGLLLGEGAGAVVIETERDVRRRGGPLLGFVDGFGLSCDAHHVTAPHPDGAGAVRAMRDALNRAGVDPSDVDYVNAHGTGTAHNDRMESRAHRTLFGERAGQVPVSSIKALTGHMLGAAGAVEAVASLIAMREGVVPPTWHWEESDPDCAIDCVPNEPRSRRLRHVLSNSYAFGGNNASLLLTSSAS